MVIEEQQARAIVLVQAIDSVDASGKIVTPDQRAEAEAAALKSTTESGLPDQPSRTLHFLGRYADGILSVVQQQPAHASLAALKNGAAWPRWGAAAVPVLALVLGVLTDQVANPHRVDLLSFPLLAVAAWNLVMYLLLLAGILVKLFRGKTAASSGKAKVTAGMAGMASGAGAGTPFGELRRWTSQGSLRLQRRSSLAARVAASFYAHWHVATAELAGQRIRRVLHVSAAAWALGLMLSLLSRGLVVEYRAGWESTFLDAAQVHAFLNALFAPVVALFPVAPFTPEEIRNLRFDAGVTTPLTSGARWAWLYAGLFVLLVVLPRLALAAVAAWRIGTLKQGLNFELDSPYFQRLAASVVPARIHLGLLSRRDTDRNPLLRVLLQDVNPNSSFAAPSQLQAHTLMQTGHGDELVISDIALSAPPSNPAGDAAAERASNGRKTGFWAGLKQLLGIGDAPQPDQRGAAPADRPDLFVFALSDEQDLAAAQAFLADAQKPVLLVVHSSASKDSRRDKLLAACEAVAHTPSLVAAVIDMQSFARVWLAEPVLMQAIEKLLPSAQRPGFGRIAASWEQRNHRRFADSMGAIASHLALAARQLEEVPQPSLRLRIFGADERRTHAGLMESARTRVAERVDASAAGLYTVLCELHGVPQPAAVDLQRNLDETRLALRAPLASQQQLLVGGTGAAAGAAAGATVGAHVDVFTLGATLGAGAALGALVGGGAALAALVWKNKTAADGAAQVQFSDEMLLAILESSLVRYLAVAHFRSAGVETIDADTRNAWKRLVIAEARLQAPQLAEQWQQLRLRQPDDDAVSALQALVEELGAKILRTLYPAADSFRTVVPGRGYGPFGALALRPPG